MKKILAGFSFGVLFYIILYILDFSLDSISPLAFFDGVLLGFGISGVLARIITVFVFGVVGVVIFLLLFPKSDVLGTKVKIPSKVTRKLK